MDPAMPGLNIAEAESADVPGPMAPVRDEPARSDRPASTESIGSPELSRPPEPSSTHRVRHAEPPEPDHAAIEQSRGIPRDPGSPPSRAGTTAKPAGNQRRSRGRQRERVQDAPQGQAVRREAVVRPAGRQPLAGNRVQPSVSQGRSATGNAAGTLATAPPTPEGAESAAPESRQRPGATMQDLEIGQQLAEREPPGALQTPDWTARIQAMLGERHGAPPPPAEAEPTVNVTIGRIDIRAVRKEHREHIGRADTPSRIMSLDDYLKKRDRRQR
jgi:hypothetical protein